MFVACKKYRFLAGYLRTPAFFNTLWYWVCLDSRADFMLNGCIYHVWILKPHGDNTLLHK